MFEDNGKKLYRLLTCRKCGQPYVEGFVAGETLLSRKPETGRAERQVFLLGERVDTVEDEDDGADADAPPQNLRGKLTPTPAKSAHRLVRQFAWFVCRSSRMMTETATFESVFAVVALRAQTRKS